MTPIKIKVRDFMALHVHAFWLNFDNNEYSLPDLQ